MYSIVVNLVKIILIKLILRIKRKREYDKINLNTLEHMHNRKN